MKGNLCIQSTTATTTKFVCQMPWEGVSKSLEGVRLPWYVVRWSQQGHKNPCSVAALLRGNFWQFGGFCEIFLNQNSCCVIDKLPPVYGFLLEHFYTKNTLFWGKISKKKIMLPQKFTCFCLQGKLLENFWGLSSKL